MLEIRQMLRTRSRLFTQKKPRTLGGCGAPSSNRKDHQQSASRPPILRTDDLSAASLKGCTTVARFCCSALVYPHGDFVPRGQRVSVDRDSDLGERGFGILSSEFWILASRQKNLIKVGSCQAYLRPPYF